MFKTALHYSSPNNEINPEMQFIFDLNNANILISSRIYRILKLLIDSFEFLSLYSSLGCMILSTQHDKKKKFRKPKWTQNIGFLTLAIIRVRVAIILCLLQFGEI